MALIEVDWNPPPRTLRAFAVVWFPLFALAVGLLLWRVTGRVSPLLALAALAGLLAIAGLVRPALARPAFVGLMAATWPIGWTVSHLMLAVVYYGVVTPIGLALKLVGYDPLERRLERRRTSYWVERRQGSEPEQYFRQF